MMVYLNSAIEILGVAYDGPDLVAEASRLRPEVDIVDVGMPILNGLDAARNQKPCFLGRGSSFRRCETIRILPQTALGLGQF